MRIGAQFFTIRDYCKTLGDFSESLKKVADIGYTTVQISGTCAYEADWLAEQLKANGLTCDVTHFNYDRIVGDTKKVVEEHKLFGCSHIGIGYMPGGENADYPKFLAETKAAAKVMRDAGAMLMYHNHAFEFKRVFEDGRPLLFHMADDYTPEELGFILDTYWVKVGGYDVEEVIGKFSGRLPIVHLKDLYVDETGKSKMAWVGGGNQLDFERIIPAFEKAGTQFAYVEQDICEEDPFVCLKKSYQYLTSLGLK